MCYNKMDFLKEQEMPNGHMGPVRLQKETKEPRRTNRNHKSIHPESDQEFMKDIERYITKEVIDSQQLKMIERFWQGEALMDY